MAHIVMARTL
jgi:hypothetical protein